jgi:hypothetical protein
VSGEGDNPRAGIELDDADLDFFGKLAVWSFGAVFRRAWDFEVFFAAGDDGAGEVKELSELVDLGHVFEGTGEIFGDEEVVAVFEAEPFTDVFVAVAEGPADADGLFDDGISLLALSVKGVLRLDPMYLVREKGFGEGGIGVEFDGRENGTHLADVK